MTLLYEFPPTRSNRAKWALEELGVSYDRKTVDLMSDEQNGDDYREIQPLGVVPALKTDGYTMFESIAIVLQSIDEHPDQSLAPPPGSPERALYYQWALFAAGQVDPAIMLVFDNTMRPLEGMRPAGSQHDPAMAEKGRYEFGQRAAILSDTLNSQDYLLGDNFTGADIIVGHSCFMATTTGLIDGFPVLKDYRDRLKARPAAQRVYG
jgi:glutathione S-transferase